MSLSIDVHIDMKQLPTLDAWRISIEKLNYALTFPDDFSPTNNLGVLECNYDGEMTEIEYYFNDAPEIASPSKVKYEKHCVCEFRINTRNGQFAWFAAVAAAASLCISSGGIIEDSDGEQFSFRRAKSWAKAILTADEEFTRQALSFPHPDSVEIGKSPSQKPWWKLW